MKKSILTLAAVAMTAAASAQTAFTLTYDNGKQYSFPIDAEITLTNNKVWTPDTVVKTVYVRDTVYLDNSKISIDALKQAAAFANSKLGARTAIYTFDSDKDFSLYASYYEAAAKKDTTGWSADDKASWETALTQLRKVNTAWNCYNKGLVNPLTTGKYLFLGQGGAYNPFAFYLNYTTGSCYNKYVQANASGYVAYAKKGVSVSDTTVFTKAFTNVGRTPCFGGSATVDVYVLYNAVADRYTPVYTASVNGMLIEQWKGSSANNYVTLDDAISHLGPNSGNMADRYWVPANIDLDGDRNMILNNSSNAPDLSAYTNVKQIYSAEDPSGAKLSTPGVTINTATTPMTFTKNGEACEFSGVVVFTANDSKGGSNVYLMSKTTSGKYSLYSWPLAE